VAILKASGVKAGGPGRAADQRVADRCGRRPHQEGHPCRPRLELTYTSGCEYDAAGNVVNVTYPSGRIVFFDRDDDGRTEVIRTLPPGGSMAWQWVGRTPFGPRSGILFGNNMREVRHYDQDGRITSLETLIDGRADLGLMQAAPGRIFGRCRRRG
jgi:YD repeat-containing protein